MRPFVGVGRGRPCCGKVYQALGLPSMCFCFKHILGVRGRIYLNHKLTRLDGGQEFPFQVITFHKIVGCDSGPTAGLVASSSLGLDVRHIFSQSAAGGFPAVGG